MSTPIRIRRSAVPGKVPTVEQVQLGELAVNTYDGKAFLKKDVSGVETIVNIGGGYPGKTYFVTSEGLDTNDGESISSAFATLKHALSLTVAGDTVELSSGTFTEIFPLTVPPGVIVRGKGIRSTIIQPTSGTERNDAFLLNGETTVEDVTVTNFYYDSSADTGYGFRFASGMVTSTRSPYVLRVTVLTRGSDTSVSDPYGFDTADSYPTSKVAGRGAFIDGSVVASNTLEPAMLFNEVTFITPNQTGLRMTNGARAEWVNCFTYFSSISVDGTSGSVGVASTANATLKLSGITTTVTANQVIKYYQSGSPVAIGTVVSTDGDYIVINGKGSGTFNSVGLGSAQDVRIFESDGTTQVGTASTILWADYQKFGADLRSIGSASNFGTVGVRGDGVGVQLRLFGYNFGCVGAGKTFTQDPTLTVRANEAVQLNGGRVYFQSVDQEGNFRVGNIFEISQETGAVSLASTSDINIAGTATIQNLNVTGVSTFANPLEFNSNLYISGISTFTNNVAITGFTTFSSDSMLESNLNVAGITTTATFRVTGISTLMGDVELESNLRVAGVSTFSSPAMVNSDLNVTGIATVGNFRVTGLSTITGDANFTNNVNIGGITTTSTFRVTGISTLTGDVELENNLQVAGVSTFASPAMINSDLNVTGIATVGNFRVTGISTLTGDTNFTNNVNVGGITTTSTFRVTGISTLTGDVELEGNLDVAGVSTFSSPAMINSDLNVTGISTLVGDVELNNNLRVTGVSTLTGDVQLANNLQVAGVTTFVGVTTYQNDLYVGNDLFVLGDTRIVGVLTVGSSSIVIDGTNNQINVGTGVTAHTDQVSVTQFTASGVSTFAQNVDIRTDLNVNGVTTSTALKISGVSTFSGDVELDTNLRVAGVSTFNSPAMVNSNLNVTGLTTTGNLNVVGVTTIGSSAVLNETLYVTGITTLASPLYGTSATLSDNVIINSNLTVAGNVTIGGTTIALTAQELKIKDKSVILGITTNAVDADVSTDTSANYGGIAIASTEGSPLVPLFVTGINTSPNTYKQLMWVKGDTMGAGTTDAWLSNYAVGIGSTLVPNDVRLSVGGIQLTDTNVTATKFIGRDGTISYLDGDNLYYTGIGSINTLYANAGIVTNLSVTGVSTFPNVQIGYGATDLIVTGDARVTGILTVGTASITIDGTREEIGVGETTRIHTLGFDVGNSFMHSSGIDVDDIHSSGISSLTTLYVSGISTFLGNITANSIEITGVGINTFENVDATNLTTKYLLLDASGITIVSESATIGIGTDIIGITTTNVAIGDTVSSATAITTPLVVTGFTADGLSVTLDGTTENETEVTETVTIARNTGIGTFGNISGSVGTINTLYSVTGVITTLNGTTATYTTINGTDGTISNLTSSEIRGTNLDYSGLGTIATFESTLSTIGVATVTTGTVTTLTSDDVTINNTAYVENLTYNIGIGTGLTIENTEITGILTANNLNITGQTYFTEIAAGIASANTGIITNFTSTNLYSDFVTVSDVNTGITTADVEIGIGTDVLPFNVLGLEVGDYVIAPSIPGGTTIVNTPYLTIVSAASTLGVATNIVGIATTGVNAGDYIESTSISQGTTVSTILTDAVEISSPSTNVTEISQVVEIYRLTGLGITISNATINSGISTELVSIERPSGVGVGRFSTLYVNSGIITSLSTNEIDLTGSLSVTDVNVSSAATITTATITNVTVEETVTANAGIVTNLTAEFAAILETSAVIVSAASTLGIATDRIGITTDGVLVGDTVEGQFIQQYTLVSEILNDIVVFDQASSNVSEQTPTISITRSNNNGIGTVSTLYVNSGIATFFNITQELVGVSTITRFVADDILVSGVTTTTDLYVNTGVVTSISGTDFYYVGVSTADTLYSNVGFVTTLSGDNFFYSGISSAATLNINVGLVTHVSGTDLYYSGISTADTLYTNVGFITELSGTKATYTDADITYAYISGVGTAVNLISTVGFVTFVTGENLNYTGVGTIQNLEGLGIGYTTANLEFVTSIDHTVTGISTIENLFVNVGIATTLSGDRLTYNIADLTDTYTSGVSSISTLKAAVGLVTYASGTNLDYAGVGTINFLEGNNLSYTGIVTLGIVTATALTTQDFNLGGGALNFTGIATITNIDSVNITADYISGENLNYSGIGTINVLNLYEVQTEAFTTTSSLHVGVGGSLFSVVSGIGSVGIGTTNAREKLHVYGNIMYGDDLNTGTTRVAISSDGATTIHESLSRLEYRSVEYQIQASTSGVGATGRYQFTRILAVHDGTTAFNVEYANVGTGTDVSSYIIDIDEGLDAGYIRLQATPAQIGITTFLVNFVGYRI